MNFRRTLLFVFLLALTGALLSQNYKVNTAHAQEPSPQQTPEPVTPLPSTQNTRLVESVDLQGNRRLRDEDILGFYVQTKVGDAFNPAQVERDLQTILSLPFFDKTASRVLTQDGPRGGVEVIFEVKELPIIRDITFDGLKAVAEADVLKAFREQRIGVSKESVYDPVKVNNAKRTIRELLAARGYPNAKIDVQQDEVSLTSTALTFNIDQGERVRVVDIEFEGNQVFGNGELRRQMKYVKEAGLISRFKGADILDRQKLEEDLRRVTIYMRSKGYLNARTGEPRIEGLGQRTTGFFIPLPIISSTDDALKVTIPVTEDKVYRLGEIKIEGNSIFSENDIRRVIGLVPGEIANGDRLSKALYEDLKRVYGSQGFIQYTYDVEPNFKDNPTNAKEGVADFTITIDEGKQFTLRRLEFSGNTFTRDNVLRREFLLNEGDVYNQQLFEYSITKLGQTGYFDPIDKDRDADLRTNEETAETDLTVKVTERGRNQISFNGGISGIGGSFFGLEYSTNNLLGRGENLAINLAAGNRQRSIYFSFTEPYIRNRPVTAGFTLFSTSRKFVGTGVFLGENTAAQQAALSTFNFLTAEDASLFTEVSNGASLFLSAPLSEFYRKRRFTQFSRVGISYSLSQTSVKEPTNNDPTNAATFVPSLYTQPNILTSRITPTFVYDTRNGSIDPTQGRQLQLSLAFAGLGGDVRTYQPFVSYSEFRPVRRKRSRNPEVFAYRILAGTIGSFAQTPTVRNANSLAFINGVPIFERFFLGDEFTIRGYEPRQISPRAASENFVTSQNVVLASNPTGTPTPVQPELSQALLPLLVNNGVVTGTGGANPALIPRFLPSQIQGLTPEQVRLFSSQATGADSQLLGNFEYRVPIFGPVSFAAFADIGSAFNIRKGSDIFINSNFFRDDVFFAGVLSGATPLDRGDFPATLNSLAVRSNQSLALAPLRGGLVVVGNRLVTQEELNIAIRNSGGPNTGNTDPITGLPLGSGFNEVFLRGDAQTNTAIRVSESFLDKIGDYRASLGGELRIQVPVVNVPFRLIYAFNPNARRELGERNRVFRFSIGRTF